MACQSNKELIALLPSLWPHYVRGFRWAMPIDIWRINVIFGPQLLTLNKLVNNKPTYPSKNVTKLSMARLFNGGQCREWNGIRVELLQSEASGN